MVLRGQNRTSSTFRKKFALWEVARLLGTYIYESMILCNAIARFSNILSLNKANKALKTQSHITSRKRYDCEEICVVADTQQ